MMDRRMVVANATFASAQRTRNATERPRFFFTLPTTAADADPEEMPLMGGKQQDEYMRLKRMDKMSSMFCSAMAGLLLFVLLAVTVLSYMRLSSTIEAVDRTISVSGTTADMLRDVRTVLNSSAHMAAHLDRMGVHVADFSAPLLARLLNDSAHGMHKVASMLSKPKLVIETSG